MISFRNLTKDEIEVRVSEINKMYVTLLLYKDARAVMRVLDDAVGNENWQTVHREVKGTVYCSLGINANWDKPDLPPRWIWKDDAGSAGQFEAEKGSASDSFKRAGSAWGIGRALYDVPAIKIPVKFATLKEKNGKQVTYDTFVCEKVKFSAAGEIIGLSIRNRDTNTRVYVWTKATDDMLNKEPKDGEFRGSQPQYADWVITDHRETTA